LPEECKYTVKLVDYLPRGPRTMTVDTATVDASTEIEGDPQVECCDFGFKICRYIKSWSVFKLLGNA
jgi:hypothetical protein